MWLSATAWPSMWACVVNFPIGTDTFNNLAQEPAWRLLRSSASFARVYITFIEILLARCRDLRWILRICGVVYSPDLDSMLSLALLAMAKWQQFLGCTRTMTRKVRSSHLCQLSMRGARAIGCSLTLLGVSRGY